MINILSLEVFHNKYVQFSPQPAKHVKGSGNDSNSFREATIQVHEERDRAPRTQQCLGKRRGESGKLSYRTCEKALSKELVNIEIFHVKNKK